MPSHEFSAEQMRILIDATQLHQAFMDAFLKSRAYRGGMHWKKAKGRAYLFRSMDRYGYGKSLGPRSKETEAIYDEFHNKKKQINERLKQLKDRLKEQARFCKAARIARVPAVVAAILRLLEQHQLLGHNLQIIGTNALYAYEAAAGIFLDSGILATRDMDVLWDIRPRLKLFSTDNIDDKGLIHILKKADRSFDLMGKQSFRAVNQTGYMVDLVKLEPRPLLRQENRQIGNHDDLVAAETRNLQWLVSAPKFRHIVIGEDGFPATMVAPDPRAFAVHKRWLSQQADRDPVKKKRDHAQAMATCKIILHHLPKFQFKPQELRMFPKSVVEEAVNALRNTELPPGIGDTE
ncbi:MAG: nucleotidyltransferase domain-containing protein [Desulfobacteraceae bacterium]